MIEFLHNAMHPFDPDGLVFAWGQMGSFWRTYWGSWQAWQRGAAAPRGWRWRKRIKAAVRRVFEWRPGSERTTPYVPGEASHCDACGHQYHGQGTDYQRTDDGEMKVVDPDPCDEEDCSCDGEDVGLLWRRKYEEPSEPPPPFADPPPDVVGDGRPWLCRLGVHVPNKRELTGSRPFWYRVRCRRCPYTWTECCGG